MRSALLALTVALAAVVSVPAAASATRQLWPGVTYEPGVQFTTRGPVVINVLRGPRPGGLTTLEPVLSNDTIVGRETLTAMQKRLATAATAAGVNGDYFTFATGRPSGILLRDGQLVTPPNTRPRERGVMTDGTPRRAPRGVRRLVARAHRDPHDPRAERPSDRRRLGALHRRLRGRDARRSPAAWPSCSSRSRPRPPRSISSRRCSRSGSTAASVAIPPGGAVLVARGLSATALTSEAPVGTSTTVRLSLRPAWPGVLAAIGGGPQLVRDGKALYRVGGGLQHAAARAARAAQRGRPAAPTGGSCSSRSTGASRATASVSRTTSSHRRSSVSAP